MAFYKPIEGRKKLQLPQTRVRTIMKISAEVQNIGQDSVHLVTKATELFIEYLAKKTYAFNNRKIQYPSLVEVVQTDETLDFLKQYVPKKITVREFKEIMALKELKENSSDDEFGSFTYFSDSSEYNDNTEIMSTSSTSTIGETNDKNFNELTSGTQ